MGADARAFRRKAFHLRWLEAKTGREGGFRRRLGPMWTYSLVGTILASTMIGLFLARERLLAREFGMSYPLTGLGLGCLAVAVILFRQYRRHLTLSTQLGLPELAPERHRGKLLTEGVYARLRHPRYVELVVALLGYALIANYLAIYILFLLCLPLLYLIVVLEERELRERFGEAYRDYCRQVPRFLPKFSIRSAVSPCKRTSR